jgi:hypothetical protein
MLKLKITNTWAFLTIEYQDGSLQMEVPKQPYCCIFAKDFLRNICEDAFLPYFCTSFWGLGLFRHGCSEIQNDF